MATAPDTAANDGTQSGTFTRRQFLVGAGATAAIGAAPLAASDPVRAADRGDAPADIHGGAHISLDGYHELANSERLQQQKGNDFQFDQRVDAVEDLGCDPNGGKPVQDTLNSKIKDGMLVVFPEGTYAATGTINPGADRFGIVGKGYQQATKPPKPGGESVVFNVKANSPFKLFNVGAKEALIGNFVIDQRKGAMAGVTARSSGNVRVRDVRTVGAQTAVGNGDSTPFFFEPFARGGDSLIVFERCVARGGGIPGTKNIGGSAGVGIFQRNGETGRIVLKDCIIENMPDNGVYGARTTAEVIVLGGLYRNNDVSQVRVNGEARVDGVTIVIDEKNYTGLKSKSNANERGPGWPGTNGLKLETDSTGAVSGGTVVKNCDLRANSVADAEQSNLGGVVNFFASAGAATLDNCRITNNVSSTTSIIASNPSSAPEKVAITVKNSVIQGNGAGQNAAVNISSRPRSIVKNTCLSYPDASKDDIKGAGASNVSFGQQCESGAGLKAPQKVGSAGNLSSLPAPSVSYNGTGGSAARRRKKKKGLLKKIIGSVFGGFLLIIFLFLGAIAFIVVGVLAGFGTLAALLGGD
ncbi:hypothetical protein MUK72_19250 (plasmid) [Halococcus dombrowskii]|uniref:Right handed beta helix domain-containing protein n=1 Tax=Halococcus dombrowskii TaxID=179637 RepID=A0AAV3SID0_HALDO|nr:hypothetical protein [Halococcus dombrowskii]UOO97289.1 hypothetical protein MUK72_19250 [Halococcus dombrowskii]